MKTLYILLAALCLVAATPTPPPDDIAPPARVIVISLDGARPDAIQQANTPHIDTLVARGAVAWHAETVFPPATIPGHASMLTGLDVQEHGVDHNDYRADPIEAPTFLLAAHEAGFSAGMVSGKEKLIQFRQHADIDYVFAREGDRSVIDAAITMLDDGVEVLFVHLPNPDYFGHAFGWMTDIYISELYSTDYQLGRLLAWLDENDLTDDTLIILTADHGGHDKVHGQRIPEDMRVPWIIAGPGVQAGISIEADVSVADTAHTVLYALGLTRPESELGRVVLPVFASDTDD